VPVGALLVICSMVRAEDAAALVPFLLVLGCKDAAKDSPPPVAATPPENTAEVHPEMPRTVGATNDTAGHSATIALPSSSVSVITIWQHG
jgi:hypothetical protein